MTVHPLREAESSLEAAEGIVLLAHRRMRSAERMWASVAAAHIVAAECGSLDDAGAGGRDLLDAAGQEWADAEAAWMQAQDALSAEVRRRREVVIASATTKRSKEAS